MSGLLDGRNNGKFTDIEFFKRVADSGPLFRIEIEEGTTSGAGNLRYLYKPSDALKEFLAAVSARDGVANNPSKLAITHGQNP